MRKPIFELKVFVLLTILVVSSLALPVFGAAPSTTTSVSPVGTISAYFSPNGGIKGQILSRIKGAKKSIALAIYTFTLKDVSNALIEAKDRGVDVRIVADEKQARDHNSMINGLASAGIKVKRMTGLGSGKHAGIMHDKFAVFDDSEVVTGSYNWTNSAEYMNYENIVIIKDPGTVGKYAAEFDKLYNK